MIIKDISFAEAEKNISYDRALLESAESGASGEALRFWEAREFFIVLGRISEARRDIKIENAKQDAIETVRRISGGGTVLQGPGCLNYSLVISYGRNPLLKNIKKSYEIILNRICAALGRLNVRAAFEPVSDMALGGKKFSGNAQARKRKYMLHHGTLLYNFPMEKIERYLTIPKEQPPYRRNRAHRHFLTNIDADPRRIRREIAAAWGT